MTRWPKPVVFTLKWVGAAPSWRQPIKKIKWLARPPLKILALDPYGHPYYQTCEKRRADLLASESTRQFLQYQEVGRMAGGMGEIHVVKETLPDGITKLAVLKSLSSLKLQSPKAIENFLQEAIVMAGVNAWPSAQLTDIVNQSLFKSQILIKMPYYCGGSLADRMDFGPVDFPEAIYHLLCVALSLAGLHNQHMVHSDLKPANVFIGSNDEIFGEESGWLTMLADFGLSSKYRDDDEGLAAGGTWAYSAPEQLLGQPVKPAMDVWAWGVVAYQLLAGHHPYEQMLSSRHALRSAFEENAELGLDFSSQVLPEVPEWLVGLIKDCLRKRPEDRPSIKEVLTIFGRNIKLANGMASASPEYTGNLSPENVSIITNSHMTGLLKHEWQWDSNYESFYSRAKNPIMTIWQYVPRLLSIGSLPALVEAEKLLDGLLGDWDKPGSVLNLHLTEREREAFPAPEGFRIFGVNAPNAINLHLVYEGKLLKLQCLIDRVEKWPDDAVIARLLKFVKVMDEMSVVYVLKEAFQFTLMAQAFLFAGDLENAAIYLNLGYKADNDFIPGINTLSLYFRATGEYKKSAVLTQEMGRKIGEHLVLKAGPRKALETLERFIIQAAMSKVEAGDFSGALGYISEYPKERELNALACKAVAQFRLYGGVGVTLGVELKKRLKEEAESISMDLRDVRFLSEAAWLLDLTDLSQALAAFALSSPKLKFPWFSMYQPFFKSIVDGSFTPKAEVKSNQREGLSGAK
jgi:serine/threonine protein kinase